MAIARHEKGCIGFRPVPRARQLTRTHHGWLESLDECRGFPSLGPSIPGVCGVCRGLSLGTSALGLGQSLLSLNSDALEAFPDHEDPTQEHLARSVRGPVPDG